MARKKKSLPIDGIGNDPDNKLIVQKSRPLFALWSSDLSLAEFKILDMYLSRINTRDPDHRTVRLTKGQLEAALGVTRINKPDLKARLKHLYQPIDLAKGDKKRFHLVGLFEEAEAEQDDDGQWQVTLTCTQGAMKYIFKAEELGYLRYKLRSITSLTSRYSYVLFCYLEDNRFRKTWEIGLSELRTILNCDTEDTYKEYKRFNDLILKRCHQELQEKTDCRFTYEPVRAGRRVTAIRFTLETLPMLEPAADPDQLDLFKLESDHLALLREALPGFTETEVSEVFAALVCVPEYKLPAPDGITDIDLRRYHYIAQQYARMMRVNEKKPIKHKQAYLLKLIKADAG